MHALVVRFVLTVRHWFRVGIVALFVFGWIGLCHGDTGDWFAVA